MSTYSPIVRVERRELGRGDRPDPGELGRPETLMLRESLDLRHQLVATLKHQDVAASELGLGDQPRSHELERSGLLSVVCTS
jgi:hypothetical protein